MHDDGLAGRGDAPVPSLVSMICRPVEVVTGFAADWAMACPLGLLSN